MNANTVVLRLLVASILSWQTAAFADDDMRPRDGKRWWRGEWKTEFRDGPCMVKQEAKRDEFKEEVKCEGRR